MKLYAIVKAVLLTVTYMISENPVLSRPASEETVDDYRALTQARIVAIQQKILDGLNYTSPPTIPKLNDSIETKRRMIKKYRDYMRSKETYLPEEDTLDQSVETKTHVYKHTDGFWRQHKGKQFTSRNALKLFFKLDVLHPEDHMMETVVPLAKLKIFKHTGWINKLNNTQTEIVLKIFKRGDSIGKKHLLQSRIIDISRDGWEIFDISSTAHQWVDNPDSNNGLEIYTDTFDITKLILPSSSNTSMSNSVKSINSSQEDIHFPILEFQTHVRPILKRIKRQDAGRRDCTKGDNERRCCRFSIEISFRDLGWNDWILAPETYNAYFCDGTCPDRFKLANTFAGIQSRLHLKYPSTIPKLCCVPSSLSPLTILHKDEKNQYRFKDYPDMIVEDCKCS